MNISISVNNLREAYDYLRSLGKVHTQKDIADIMGSTPPNVSKAFNGDSKYLTQNFLSRFNHAFGDIFNSDWLSGEGENMLRSKNDVAVIPCYYNEKTHGFHANGDDWPSFQDGWYKICEVPYIKWDRFRSAIYNLVHDSEIESSNQFVKELWLDYNFYYDKGNDTDWQPPENIIRNFRYTDSAQDCNIQDESDFVPLLPVEAMAGSLQNLSDGIELSNCRKIKSPVNGADWAIQVSGDSMEPDYRNGSYLFIKKMTGSFIPWGNTMVIDTYDGVIVKNIFPADEDEYIEARSINPKYPPFKIEKSIILGIYRVLGGTFINSTI